MFMKKIILLFLIILFSFEAKSQWVLQSQPSIFDIFSCGFLDANTGYICGYGNSLFKTTNGGQSWIDLSFPTTAQNLNVVYFFDVNRGFVCSTNDSLYRTTNGGQSWTPVFIGFQAQTVSFPNLNTGYVSGLGGIARTTDAGITWASWIIQGYGDIFFINPSTGWTTNYTGTGSDIYKTTNGGNNWILQYSSTNFRIIYNFYFINENTSWAVGYRELILKTTDGGINWATQCDVDGMPGIYSIYFINPNTGWAAGDFYFGGGSKVFFTTNGGDVWQSFFLSTNAGRLSQVQFVNQNTGFITGQYGNVFKTEDRGGLTSVSGIVNSVPKNFKLMQNYPNPFNPVTKIKFDIPSVGQRHAFDVRLNIFDISGVVKYKHC
jgi:photosystem II stability/assembly factor-like uncharacterized protein